MASICSANREILYNDISRKSCWLPSDESSPWNYCRHCTFVQKNKVIEEVTKLLQEKKDDLLMPNGTTERILNIIQTPWFQQHCAHPASRLRLYNLMMVLQNEKKDVYTRYIRNPILVSSFNQLIQDHRPQDGNGASCKLICDLSQGDLLRIPRQCPVCLYNLWRTHRKNQQKVRDYFSAFSSYLRNYDSRSYKYPNPTNVMKEVIHHSVSIAGDSTYIHAYHIMNMYFRRLYPQGYNERFYTFVQDLLLEDSRTFAAIVDLNLRALLQYCPEWFIQDEFYTNIVYPAHTQWKQIMKARCDTYKEDLMIKTWHPSRLFTWGYDIQEIKDFGYTAEEIKEIQTNFNYET